MVCIEIKLPKTEESKPETFAQFLSSFANQPPRHIFRKLFLGQSDNRVSLEIVLLNQSIHFIICVEDYLRSYFMSLLSSYYPKARLTPLQDYMYIFSKTGTIAAGQMTLTSDYYYPLQTYQNFKNTDPIVSLLSGLSKADKQDKAVIQFQLLPAPKSWKNKASALVTKGIVDTSTNRRSPLPNEQTIRTKTAVNGFRTGIRIVCSSPNTQQANQLLTNIAGTFGVYARGDGNSLRFRKARGANKRLLLYKVVNRSRRFISKFHVITTDELACMFHPAGENIKAVKNIAWGGQLFSEPPENLPVPDEKTDKEINFFARTEFKNKQTVFGVKRADRRRHLYVIGKTGTGKTTLIANMAINDMRNGEGLAVIDPHGDLCEILLNYVPKNRINDIAYLDPSDSEYAFRLNPLELSDVNDRGKAELIASGIVSIFHKLYSYSWGPRLEYVLRNSLLTLTYIPNSTLVDLPVLLTDLTYRNHIVERVPDPVLKNYWTNEFNKMGERLKSESISPILNKVGQFVASPMIRNIIGHPKSTIQFNKMMDEGKIVIANLSQGKLGEDNASLLGAMFITNMQLAAMSRVHQEEEKRRDFYLYVDEFQNFATQSFIKILSEARKYRLDLILANQYIGQIDEQVRKAIFGNIGSIASFVVGAEDAKHLSFEFGNQYEPKDFIALQNYQLLTKLTIDNLTAFPFHAVSLPLPKNANQNREKVIRVSRERYGVKLS
jgi:hypothetical protein